MAGPDGRIVIPDPNSVASQFASKVREICDKQTTITAQGAGISKKVSDVTDQKKVQDEKNVKNAKDAQTAKNVPVT